MAVIHVLDKHTAELIAAGEVVERPASVVKELLENSIDAGASQITVSIESGGVKLIEISDNGTGIEAEYISTAFIRHATSKIQTPDDLVSIHTLGFRGEALASIASVARVELTTRTEQDEFATVYCIEGGEELSREPGARAVGTTIRVQDLFYNTPARMKFLKKDSSEGTFVADIVAHVALSHPEVSFKFVREGKLQYVTPGDGQLRSAAYAVLGRELAEGTERFGKRYGVRRIPVVKRQALAGYDPRALKGTGVTCATSPMGGDHTAGNTIGMPGLDPLGTAGQVEASRAAQTLMAVFDSLGMCIFSAMPSEDAAVFGLVGEMLAGVYGGSWTPDDVLALGRQTLGRQTLENEKRFNAGAHIDASEDDVPAFMREEALPPHGSVFDIPREQLASTLDFSAGQRG